MNESMDIIVQRHMLCVRSITHLVESAALLAGGSVFNNLWKQKLINTFSYCLQKILLK